MLDFTGVDDFDDSDALGELDENAWAEPLFGMGDAFQSAANATLDTMSQFHHSLQGFVDQFANLRGLAPIRLIPQPGLNNATAECGIPFVPGDEVIYYDPDLLFGRMDPDASLGIVLHEIGHLVNSHEYLDPSGISDPAAIAQMAKANQAMEFSADAFSVDAMRQLGIDPNPFLEFLSRTQGAFTHPDGLARHFHATLQYLARSKVT
jgi:hypothetical protein